MKIISDIMDAMGIVDEVEEEEIPHKSREERRAKYDTAQAVKAVKEAKATKKAEEATHKASATAKIKSFFKDNEELEEDMMEAEEAKQEAPGKRRLNFKFGQKAETAPAPVAVRTAPVREPEHKPALPPFNAGNVDMQMLEPTSFDDSQKIADCLHNNQAVIVNFEKTDPLVAKRMTDFISGTIYALQGNMKKIGRSILVCAPKNVDIDSGVGSYISKGDEF